MKILITLILLAILYCLISGIVYLVKPTSVRTKLATALTWRFCLSFALFVFLLIAYFVGWITPNPWV